MRRKQSYNNIRIIYEDPDGIQTPFRATEITSNQSITDVLNITVKNGGSRYITESEIEFVIDGILHVGNKTKRIVDIPDIKPVQDNNTRRGVFHYVKVLVTT